MSDGEERAAERVVIIGASGFIGRHLAAGLAADGWQIDAVVRRAGSAPVHAQIRERQVGDLAALSRDQATVLLDGARHVIHLASAARGSPEVLRALHVDTTQRLLRTAMSSGVSSFLYTSSVRAVTGAASVVPVRVDSQRQPQDRYGQLKAVVEEWLEREKLSPMRALALRLPLVYGEDGGPNFARLVKLVRARAPLPIPRTPNRRSMLYIGNLLRFVADWLATESLEDTSPIHQICDEDPLSSAELIRAIARAAGVEPRLWTMPDRARAVALRLPIARAFVARLTGSLVVEPSTPFAWTPPYRSEQSIESAARALLKRQSH